MMHDATGQSVEQRRGRLEAEDPQVLFSDKCGSDPARIGLQRGRPLINFLDETGNTLWTAPSSPPELPIT
jgi:hypothetical protein